MQKIENMNWRFFVLEGFLDVTSGEERGVAL